jgi:Flp pilus assembly protein TadG
MLSKKSTRTVRTGESGVALGEFAIILPLLLVVLLGVVDLGRLMSGYQTLNDLSREAANLVSRGASMDAAVAAIGISNTGPVDVVGNGAIIISTLTRRSDGDSTPWVVDQFRSGTIAGSASRVGSEGGPARMPNVDALETGVTVMAVELVHGFEPLFPIDALGLDLYPEVLYEAAFF